MKKILMITGKDYDDSEVLYPYYRLTEEGYTVDVASAEKGEVAGKYHFKINANLTFDNVNTSDYAGLMLPGGKAPERIRLIDRVCEIVREFERDKKPIAAICHGQQLLISADVLKGKKATCYPGMEDQMGTAQMIPCGAVQDGNVITGRAAGSADEFGLACLRALKGEDTARQVASDIVYRA